MTVSAQFYVSVNSGANQSGGVDVPSLASVKFVPASIVGWLRARYEIYDYPEGWATPSGWTLDSNGTIYVNDVNALGPPAITMPDNGALWGVWMVRCMVNEQLDTSEVVLDGLYYDSNALSLLSPSGLRDCGARESQHFTTATTRTKAWLRSYQRNLRALENPKATANSTSTTPVIIRSYPMVDGDVKSIRAVVKVRNAAGTTYGEYEVKGQYRKVSGTVSANYAVSITTVVESNASLNVTVTTTGNTGVQINGVGLAATNLIWEMQESFF
ncbi:MAG TPA: hypothetical protein PKL08_15460 [Thermoanaerobaculaceae bacterium]|nr:hypothetical protein [Thermoanaerobaculaceae bacterium]